MKRITLTLCLSFSFLVLAGDEVRISAFALKNFGTSKAKDPHRLKFIAERIAEQAIHGVCAVDELQNKDGAALQVLDAAVDKAAGMDIVMVLSPRVGDKRKEQFGFFYNPETVSLIGEVTTVYFDEIERDPGIATFKVKGGFDFTLCAFHTRPSGEPLRKELAFLDDVFRAVQDLDPDENDIIFLGDFNASPEDRKGQTRSMIENMGPLAEHLHFVIRDVTTNVLGNKLFDNIFFDKRQTDEYIETGQNVVRLEKMLDKFTGKVPEGQIPVKWFGRNVLDHSPVYAEFKADADTD